MCAALFSGIMLKYVMKKKTFDKEKDKNKGAYKWLILAKIPKLAKNVLFKHSEA